MFPSIHLEKKPRAVVAMSGGVDSSVTACLLKEQGYDVVGVTLNLQPEAKEAGRCCGGMQDACDAARVCHTIGIPHYVLNYADLFQKAVVDDFVETYAHGKTPVPCIRCNERVKFSPLLELSKDLGAQFMATGHYSILQPVPDEEKAPMGLYTPFDLQKDQTYFLFATTQEQLNFLRFPLGELSKTQVRTLAAHYNLAVAQKKDSQDICFIQDHYSDVLAQRRPEMFLKGPIVDREGTQIGEHRGLPFYTIGQRKGLSVASSTGKALYVLNIDQENNTLMVGPREDLLIHGLRLSGVNWLGKSAYVDEIELYVKIRSSQEPSIAQLTIKQAGEAQVTLLEGEYGVARGQACVFYEKKGSFARVLGGGWIEETHTKMHERSDPKDEL